jgi:quercetin dioxygenase-like cupin family protein
MRTGPLALLLVALAAPVAAQTAAPELKWGPAPPFFPAGARFVVLSGDPGQAGLFTVRLEMPDGFTIRPHFHPTDEHVTVISGALLLGTGDTVRTSAAQLLNAGGYTIAKGSEHHYAVARGKTVVQVHGQGPFDITYVNPKDDPRTAAKQP